MNKEIKKLNSTQGYFLLDSLEARVNFSSKLVGFSKEDSGYVKSNLDSVSFENIWARGVFLHEMSHYYQNSMTPIGVIIRLSIVAKSFLTYNFMANEGVKRDDVSLIDLNSNSTLYHNFMLYHESITNLQTLFFGLKNFTQKEALNILTNSLGVLSQIGNGAPNYFNFLKIDKPLNYFYEEDTKAIPSIKGSSKLFDITILMEGWSACVQIVEHFHSLYYEDNLLNRDIKDIINKIFYDEYAFVPESVSIAIYEKRLLELESDEFFIVINLTKILVELSFYSPIHPSFVELNSTQGISWVDIYPSWRFLKSLSIIKDIDLYGIDNYQDSYNKITEIICNKFNWPHPKDFLISWEKIKPNIILETPEDDLVRASLSQIKILQAYDASISIKEKLGIEIFSLYPERAEQLTTPRSGNESLLIPPLVLFSDREMIDIENFTPLFFQYMLVEFTNCKFYGYKFEPKKIVESYFVNQNISEEAKVLVDTLMTNIDNIIEEILK